MYMCIHAHVHVWMYLHIHWHARMGTRTHTHIHTHRDRAETKSTVILRICLVHLDLYDARGLGVDEFIDQPQSLQHRAYNEQIKTKDHM
jgi:hypothetical protein